MGLLPLIVAGWQPTSPKCPPHYEWQLTKSPPLDLPALQLASLSLLSPDKVYYIGMDIFICVQVCLPMCTHVRGQCQMSSSTSLGAWVPHIFTVTRLFVTLPWETWTLFFLSPNLELAVSARLGVQWAPMSAVSTLSSLVTEANHCAQLLCELWAFEVIASRLSHT